MFESTTVLCCHFVGSLIIGYFFVSRQIFSLFSKSDLFGSFKNLSLFIIIGGVITCFMASRLLSNSGDDDESGILGRAASLSKGIVNRRTSKGFIYIQFALTCVLVAIQVLDWEEYRATSIFILVLWVLNLIVPITVLIFLDEEAMRKAIGSPRNAEVLLMNNKGKDKDFEDVKSSRDYYMLVTVVAINAGMSITVSENVGIISQEKELAASMR